MFEAFTTYTPHTRQEVNDKKLGLDLLECYGSTLVSRQPAAHFTSSALILSPDCQQICFIYHRLFDSWSWTGGHLDGNPDFLEVALKEAREETGLKDLTPWSTKPIAFNILPVFGHLKHNEWVSAHLHLNLTYVLFANPADHLVPNLEETKAVRWFPIHEIAGVVSEPELLTIYQTILQRISIS